MYFGIDTSNFKEVAGVEALLSAAEMLKGEYPFISSPLVQYASGLVENYLVQAGSDPQKDSSFSSLKKLAEQMKSTTQSTPAQIERFGDALMASADGNTKTDFYRLAYLAYNSISIYNKIPQRVLMKLAKIEPRLGLDQSNLHLSNTHTTQQSPIPLPTLPKPQKEAYQPLGNENQQSTNTRPDQHTENTSNALNQNARNLTELARNAFAAGQNDVAFTAINAAINELQKDK